ncbi:MAG: hypothetical protein WCL04_05660 [Verrucomicrobiota bacterium]
MITQPLGLTARLRPLPPGHDAIFYVNMMLIALFFTLFGSRFVLAPGLEVSLVGPREAIRLPAMPGAVAGARTTDVTLTIQSSDMIMVDTAVLRMADVPAWLAGQAKNRKNLRLLVKADQSLPTGDLTHLFEMADKAGFSVLLAGQPAAKN